jgi:monoamine oxidase
MRRSTVLSWLSRSITGSVHKELVNHRTGLSKSSGFHLGRRSFLKAAAFSAAGITAPSLISGCKSLFGQKYSIGIVGAGLAGLTTAYQLQKIGISTTIFESSRRAGGRVFTVSSTKNKGRYYEAGGEFIDSNHESTRKLCKELGIELIDTMADARSSNLIPQDYLIDGVKYSAADVLAAFASSAPRVAGDLESCGDNYDTEDAARLDKTSLADYVNSLPMDNWLKSLLIAAYEAEYGLSGTIQSSLNFIDMIRTDLKQDFSLYGESDERYRVKGGSSQIVQALAGQVGKSIQYGKSVIGIDSNGKRALITFADGATASYDALVLAIPFSVLREIKLSLPMMSQDKRRCINELSYGNNCKVVLPFSVRTWRKSGSAGYLVNETIQNGWDATQGQSDNKGAGLYTIFLGADPASEINAVAAAAQSMAKEAVSVLNVAYSGSGKDYSGGYELARWQSNPLSKGSYPAYSVGQWTSISGYEAEPVANVFFAGDHTSDAFQGYMNGAVESGERASKEISEYVHSLSEGG